MRYLITFSCYGCHLHGCESGSVDRRHNTYGLPSLPTDEERRVGVAALMTDPPYRLDDVRRSLVMKAMQSLSSRRGWLLVAAHVRTTHVHVVIEADCDPERVMCALKAQASHCLNESGLERAGLKRWTRQGSTRWLWNERDVATAVRYVVEGQGEAMAVFQGA
jgi:REP element-mobilizing transposase RayT